MDEMFPSTGMCDDISEFFVMTSSSTVELCPYRTTMLLNLTRTLLSWCRHKAMEILWMAWTSNIEHWLPVFPMLESSTVHVSNVGWRWVATRPTYSLMQLGFGFERMLWWFPATNDFHLVSVDM
jgi:hypothetical protein